MSSERILVFIYNANSGAISLVKDFWHKLLKPSTYQCNLCFQTFSTFGVKKDWKNFIENLDIDTEFLHKDEFEERYEINNAKYPCAYIKNNGNLTLFITQDEMNAVKSIDELKNLVDSKLKDFGL